jgi:lipopolysaccharide/colanic/teichoic acid biosynthesis glycosyltransferase
MIFAIITMYRNYFKRLFDFIGAGIALLILFPFLLLVGILLTIANKGAGALFIQPRPGLNGEIFYIVKFRTMTNAKDNNGQLLPDEKRLTKTGRIIRSLSIDELPQLVNVFKGDMSFIGPRPLMVSYLERYNAFQARRHEVRPGMSGWAQVNGRNTISWERKFEYDVWYVDHLIFLTDLKILFMTLKNVFCRKDIHSETTATMEEFMGSKQL